MSKLVQTTVYELTVRAFFAAKDDQGADIELAPLTSVLITRETKPDVEKLLALAEKTLEDVPLENLRPMTRDEAMAYREADGEDDDREIVRVFP